MGRKKKKKSRKKASANQNQATIREAQSRLETAPERIERMRLYGTAIKYFAPLGWLIVFVILVALILYGPQDRLDSLIAVFDKIGINKFLSGVAWIIIGLITGGIWILRKLSPPAPPDSTEV